MHTDVLHPVTHREDLHIGMGLKKAVGVLTKSLFIALQGYEAGMAVAEKLDERRITRESGASITSHRYCGSQLFGRLWRADIDRACLAVCGCGCPIGSGRGLVVEAPRGAWRNRLKSADGQGRQ